MNTIDQIWCRRTLLKFVKKYLKKHNLVMRKRFLSIKKKLTDGKLLTERDFDLVLKFVERERGYRGYSRREIEICFLPIISTEESKRQVGTLESFFT